jgi:hypothetical protein
VGCGFSTNDVWSGFASFGMKLMGRCPDMVLVIHLPGTIGLPCAKLWILLVIDIALAFVQCWYKIVALGHSLLRISPIFVI